PDIFNMADARFHNLVAHASRSPVLIGTLDRLDELALLTRSVIVSDKRLRASSLIDVERVCAAIERKHPKRAANAMERHILTVRADCFGVRRKNARTRSSA